MKKVYCTEVCHFTVPVLSLYRYSYDTTANVRELVLVERRLVEAVVDTAIRGFCACVVVVGARNPDEKPIETDHTCKYYVQQNGGVFIPAHKSRWGQT